MNWPNINPQHIVYLVIGLIWIGGWVIKQVATHTEKRKAKLAAEQREMDLIRTGRDPGATASSTPITAVNTSTSSTPPASQGTTTFDARKMLEEVQARRAQQIEELRRRQAQAQSQMPSTATAQSQAQRQSRARDQAAAQRQAAATARGQKPTPPRAQPTPPSRPTRDQSRTGNQARTEAKARTATLTPEEYQRLKQEQNAYAPHQPAHQSSHRAAPAPQPQASGAMTDAGRAAQRTESRKAAVVESRATTGEVEVLGATLHTPAEWRRAIALQVILSKPVSLRGPEQEIL